MLKPEHMATVLKLLSQFGAESIESENSHKTRLEMPAFSKDLGPQCVTVLKSGLSGPLCDSESSTSTYFDSLVTITTCYYMSIIFYY